LIYNIVWKTSIYVLAVMLARYLERFIPFLKEDGGIVGAHLHLMHEIVWPRFPAIHIWFMVLFCLYSVLVELVRVLGKERMIKLFFGRG
jgi:hypothetical protein